MRNFDLENLAAELYGRPLAITRDKLIALCTAFEQRRAGVEVSEEEIKAIKQERERSAVASGSARELNCGMTAYMVGQTAILPLHGVVVQRPSIFTMYSGGVSCEQFTLAHSELVNDPNVKSIIWDVHSPGGSVFGVEESFQRLFGMRGKKKTVAYSNSVMCSAAYYLSCAADEISVSPSSLTGNIGVISSHVDRSKMNEALGIKVTYIYAGKYKSEGWPDQPLDNEAMQAMQAEMNAFYDQFVAAVAKGRGVSEKAVRNGFGEGRALTSKFALDTGICDNVCMLETILQKSGAYGNSPRSALASVENRLRLSTIQ